MLQIQHPSECGAAGGTTNYMVTLMTKNMTPFFPPYFLAPGFCCSRIYVSFCSLSVCKLLKPAQCWTFQLAPLSLLPLLPLLLLY